MMFGRSMRRRSALVPILLALLHISTAVGEPILHGRTEVLSSARALESGHTDHCAVIHLESSCIAGGMHHFAGRAATAPVLRAQRFIEIRFGSPASILPSFGIPLANGVRGPPQG